MTFKPINRHLLVLPREAEENKTKSGVLLPEEYKVEIPMFEPVKVVAIADDCTTTIIGGLLGRTVVVQTSMLEEVKLLGQKFYLIKENYVMGLLEDE